MTTRQATASRKCVPASPYGGRDAVGRTCTRNCGPMRRTHWDAVGRTWEAVDTKAAHHSLPGISWANGGR